MATEQSIKLIERQGPDPQINFSSINKIKHLSKYDDYDNICPKHRGYTRGAVKLVSRVNKSSTEEVDFR